MFICALQKLDNGMCSCTSAQPCGSVVSMWLLQVDEREKGKKAKEEWCLRGRKMTSTVFSRTSQGNQGAHTPLYITAPLAIGHDGESSLTIMPLLPLWRRGSLKCHPQGPKRWLPECDWLCRRCLVAMQQRGFSKNELILIRLERM